MNALDREEVSLNELLDARLVLKSHDTGAYHFELDLVELELRTHGVLLLACVSYGLAAERREALVVY